MAETSGKRVHDRVAGLATQFDVDGILSRLSIENI